MQTIITRKDYEGWGWEVIDPIVKKAVIRVQRTHINECVTDSEGRAVFVRIALIKCECGNRPYSVSCSCTDDCHPSEKQQFGFEIVCFKCGAKTTLYKTSSMAIKAWENGHRV